MNIDIIDAHMHLWDYNSGNYPWLKNRLPGSEKMIGNYDLIRKNFLVADYKKSLDNKKVKKSVHIQAFGYPENPVLESKWLQQQAEQFTYPHAIVGYANLSDANISTILDGHMVYKNVRGIRNVLCHHPNPDLCMVAEHDIMRSQPWRHGLSCLSQKNLSLDIQIFDHQLDDLSEIANIFKESKIIINHFAWPTDFSKSGFKNWCARIKKIAQFSNVWMKISGFGCVFKCISPAIIQPYMNKCFQEFGLDRCVWGSNFPVEKLFITYGKLLDLTYAMCRSLSKIDQEKFFYKNAEIFYKI